MADAPSTKSAERINLRQITTLAVDSNGPGLDILGQMLMGFGVERIVRANSMEQAQEILQSQTIDLMISDGMLSDGSGYDLVRWLRRTALEPNRYTPTIIVSSLPKSSAVTESRECGANFMVAKPASPSVLMSRIQWVARGGRNFVESPNYVGPDRRWKFEGPPLGQNGRRHSDLTTALGSAVEPNLSQAEINSVIKPQKVAL